MSLQVSLKLLYELLLQKEKQQSVHPSQSWTEKLKITLNFKLVNITQLVQSCEAVAQLTFSYCRHAVHLLSRIQDESSSLPSRFSSATGIFIRGMFIKLCCSNC